MIADIIEIAKVYGIPTALAIVIGPWLLIVDRRSRKNEERLKNVHLQCHIPQNAVTELKEEVDSLKDVDHALEKEISLMKNELVEIKTDVKWICSTLKRIEEK